MNKESISIIIIVVFIAIVAFFIIIPIQRNSSLMVSCNNHQRFLQWDLNDYIAENGHFPYDANKQGYIFLAEFSSNSEATVNCNHGAPNSSFGGWQMVNLSPEAWSKVFDKWGALYQNPIPFAWCGRPTGVSTRLVTIINYQPKKEEHSLSLFHKNMEEEELEERLKRLNKILKEIGEAPVSLNIPEGIDWQKYKIEKNENEIASPNSDSAAANPE